MESYISRVSRFDWDAANTEHIARHNVTVEEVEQAFANDPVVALAQQKRGGEERTLCVGLTDDGRAVPTMNSKVRLRAS